MTSLLLAVWRFLQSKVGQVAAGIALAFLAAWRLVRHGEKRERDRHDAQNAKAQNEAYRDRQELDDEIQNDTGLADRAGRWTVRGDD